MSIGRSRRRSNVSVNYVTGLCTGVFAGKCAGSAAGAGLSLERQAVSSAMNVEEGLPYREGE